MANDDPAPVPPVPPAGNGGGAPRRSRGGKSGEHAPRKGRLPQRDVAEDEPAQAADSSPVAAAVAETVVSEEASRRRLDLAVLKEMSIQKLIEVAKDLEIPGASSMKKQELVFQILRAQAEKEGLIFS